jgi:hypothetical protein
MLIVGSTNPHLLNQLNKYIFYVLSKESLSPLIEPTEQIYILCFIKRKSMGVIYKKNRSNVRITDWITD